MPLDLQALLDICSHAGLKLYEKLIGLAGVLKKFKDIKKNFTIGLNKVKLPIGGTEVTLLAMVKSF